MAIQTVDFSAIETVTKDGTSLTQVVLDGSTLWTSAYLGQLWTLQDQPLFGDAFGDEVGEWLLTDLDATRIVTNVRNRTAIYTWSGSFWVQEFFSIWKSTYINSAGDFMILVNPNPISGDVYTSSRSGTSWSTPALVGGVTSTERGKFLSGDESVFIYYQSGNNNWYWSLGVGAGASIASGVYNCACNNDGSVVAVNVPNATRNGVANTGEIRVYEGTVGVLPTTQKGAFITGTSTSALLGGSEGTGSLAMDSSGDRIAATHAGNVRVYDWNGSSWVLTNSLDLGATISRFQMSSDGLSMLIFTAAQYFLYEEIGGVWTLAGPTTSIGSPDSYLAAVMSYDKSTVVAGFAFDDTNGINAGVARKFKLI